MSDQEIDHLRHILKQLNERIEKLGRSVEQLEVLAYRYQKLSLLQKEMSELLSSIDVMAFEIRQEYMFLKQTYQQARLRMPSQ